MSEQVQELVKKRRVLLPPHEAESTSQSITGPLGIWPCPILNILIQLIERLRGLRSTSQPPQAYLPKVATRRTEYIRDSQGRIIEKLEEISVD
jgi:hypothetical protein